MKLTLLILILRATAYAPVPAPTPSDAARVFVSDLRDKGGVVSATVLMDLFDAHTADLVLVMELSADLLENHELKHGKGCRFDEARPKKYKCACGLLRRVGMLRAALQEWERKNP